MKKYNPVQEAYRILVEVMFNEEATIEDFAIAVEEAVGFLGEALE